MGLQFKLTLPPVTAADVVTREVTVTVAENPPIVKTIPAAQAELIDDGFVGEESIPVVTNLVHIDGAGNRSPDHIQNHVLIDDQPPHEAGDVGLVVTAQV